MGRPLNKKYFGNRNIGTGGYQVDGNLSNSQEYADDRIGGEGIAGATLTGGNGYPGGAYIERMPTIASIDPPTIPGGVQAVASVTDAEAVAAAVHTRGTGYKIGDIIEQVGGTGTAARYRVTQLRVLTATLGDLPNSGNFDGGENLVWDSGVDNNWTTPTIITNVASTGSPNYDLAGTYGSFSGGVWDGTVGAVGGVLVQAPVTLTITGGNNTPNPTNPSYNTRGNGDLRGHTGSPSVDNNGAGGTVTFTYGIEAVELVSGGDYTGVSSGDSAVTNVTVGATGTDATLDVYYGIKTITVTEKGSGYTGAETITFLEADPMHSETQATGTIVLTTDTGAVGSATNQENAIIIHADVSGNNVFVGDIIKQVSTRRYKVKTSEGIAICKLVANSEPARYEAYIKATDEAGSTYFVTKLTAHKAVLTQWNEGDTFLFANGTAVPWTFDSAANGRVIIENA